MNNHNPDEAEAGMPGAWVTCDRSKETVPGWNSEQKKLLPDEEPEGPYEHPDVPDEIQYVYKQSLVSYFERLSVSANPCRGSIIGDKDIFLREQAIDYNDHEPLTVINHGAVIRTSKAALKQSRLDRLQEDRDMDQKERGHRARGRGRGSGGGGFSSSGRDRHERGNANETVLGEGRLGPRTSSSRARSRSPLIRKRNRSPNKYGGWARPRSPSRSDRGYSSRDDRQSSAFRDDRSWSRRDRAYSPLRDRRDSWSRDRREIPRDIRDSIGADRRESYRAERRDSGYGEGRKDYSKGEGEESPRKDGKESSRRDRRKSPRREKREFSRGERKGSFSSQREDSSEEEGEIKESHRSEQRRDGDQRDSIGRGDRRISIGNLRDSLGGKDRRDYGANDPRRDPRLMSPSMRDSRPHSSLTPGSLPQTQMPALAPPSSSATRAKLTYGEYKKRREMERQRGGR